VTSRSNPGDESNSRFHLIGFGFQGVRRVSDGLHYASLSADPDSLIFAVVLIGQNLDQELLTQTLDAALLDDKEWALWQKVHPASRYFDRGLHLLATTRL
jgi:hypothetical protein